MSSTRTSKPATRGLSDSKSPASDTGMRWFGAAACVLAAAYFLGTTVYALVHTYDYASDTPRLLRYVIGPGIIGLSLVWAGFTLRPTSRAVLGVCVLSVLFALFLVEGVLTRQSFKGIRDLTGITQASSQTRSAFSDAIPPTYTLKALNKQNDVVEPYGALLAGVPFKKVLLCSSDGKPVSYTADRYGFRNPDHTYDNPVDLMLLGDSFAEGICLEDGNDIASQLRKDGPNIVNTGTRGAGPLFELAILRRWGPGFQPPQTVMMYFEGNDMNNLQVELGIPYLRQVLDNDVEIGAPDPDEDTLDRAGSKIDDWWKERADSIAPVARKRALIRNFLALQQTALTLGLHYPRAAPNLAKYATVLERARETVESWGGEVSLVYVPQVDRYVGVIPSAAAYDAQRNRVRIAAEVAGIRFIDLTTQFWNHESPLSLFAPDSHFSPEGARIAAETILEEIGN